MKNGRVWMRRWLLAAMVVVSLGAGSRLRNVAPVWAAQAAGPQDPGAGCCGVITPEGKKLAALLDSMHVEQRWLAHEHINWETGETDRPETYQGPDKATHCSSYAAAVGERLGVYMLRPPEHPQQLLASAQAAWFHEDEGSRDGWNELSGPGHDRWGQELANQGNLVVIVYQSPDPHKPGHIVVIRPSNKTMDDLKRDGPEIAQAGGHNTSDGIAAQSFTSHPGAWPDGVRYYWHFVDWTKVKMPEVSTGGIGQ